MDCFNCQELFSDYADRTLEESLLPRLEAHLADCPDCATEWQYFADTLSWLKKMYVAAPEGLLEEIHAKLGSTDRPLHPLTRLVNFFRKGDFSFSMPAAAATLAAAAVVMLLVRNYASPDLLSFLGGTSQPAAVEQSLSSNGPERHYTSREETFRQQKQPSQALPSAAEDAVLSLRQLDMRMVTAGNPDPFATYAAVEQPSAFPGEMSSYQYHSMMIGHFPPDVKIMLGNMSTADRLALCRKLLNEQAWTAKMFSRDTMLLFVDPGELNKLHALLAGHSPEISPPTARDASFGSPKRVLTVALRLQ